MHALSAVEPGSSALTALPTLGLLNRVHDYASAALGRNALSARRFRLFASTPRELSGLVTLALLWLLLSISLSAGEIRGVWSPLPPVPTPRQEVGFDVLEGKLYVIGGLGGGSAVEAFNSETGGWEELPDLPRGLHHGSAAAVVDDQIYVAGGRLTQNGSFIRNDPTLAIYDPTSNQWSVGSPLPTPRSGHAAASIAGFLLVVGGEIPGIISANEVYDPVDNRWFRLDDLPTARHGMGVGVIGNRVLTAAGGLIDGLAPSGVSEAFNVLSEVESLAQIASGRDITSQLVLSNPGDRGVQFRFELHGNLEGRDLELSLDGARGSIFESQIEPGGLKIFTTDPVFEPAILAGAVTLYSDGPLVSNVLFSGPQGFAGVAALKPGPGHFVSVLRNLDEETDAGLAVADASGQANRITLQLLNEAGQVETQSERMLLPFGHFAEMFDELWEIAIPRLFNGSIRIEAEHEVGAVAILLRGEQFATLPVRPLEP